MKSSKKSRRIPAIPDKRGQARKKMDSRLHGNDKERDKNRAKAVSVTAFRD
jgi:hypothetical protein